MLNGYINMNWQAEFFEYMCMKLKKKRNCKHDLTVNNNFGATFLMKLTEADS